MTAADRPLGAPLPDFMPPPHPRGVTLSGHYGWLRPLRTADDAGPLFAHFKDSPWVFDYLGEAPPADVETLQSLLAAWAARADCEIFAIGAAGSIDPLGYACLMSVVPAAGDIEIGNVNLSPTLQRTPLATQAFGLMLAWAFEVGYRRVVWKCNALNAPSRRAAQRLGFSYEGVFRNHLIVKGRNRDTAWFAMTDSDWLVTGPAYAAWLDPRNFDDQGLQRTALGTLTAPHLVNRDPTL
ncbi:GNAT family N-acetyltransferase [Loktanella sp. DJP18]|uniref:GNAT family N-acetyltransferase n=1 Tax=Loktanella sp. DJP18 TaxID=3409788 RepID=UPI003BB816DC